MEPYKKGFYLTPKMIVLLFQAKEPQFGIVKMHVPVRQVGWPHKYDIVITGYVKDCFKFT